MNNLKEIFSVIFSERSIFYPPYFISAVLISIFWLKFKKNLNFKNSVNVIFDPKVWFHKSSLSDFIFTLLNLGLLQGVLSFFENYIFNSSINIWPKMPITFELNRISEGILATLISMLAIDFASYVAHRFMHTNQFLWKFHSLHHSAKNLTPLTTYRQHPFELFFLNGVRTLAVGIALSAYYEFFPNEVPVFTMRGLGFGFFFYMFTVNLHHFNVPVIYHKWIRKIFISPHVHHIHHSRAENHLNKNFGVVFSFWDRIFNTYFEEEIEIGELEFGLVFYK